MFKSQKSVLITGCSSGIGHALALEFYSRGLHVFATARSINSIQDLADLGMTTLELDVTDNDAVLRARDQVSKLTGGKLDILVNNAGKVLTVAASDLDMDQVQALYDTNVFGPMRMVKAFVQLLIAAGDARILQIGSIAACAPMPFLSAYNGTKGALRSYGDTLRIELAPFGIRVINVCTGGVTTRLREREQITGLSDNSIYKPMEDIYVAKRHEISVGQGRLLSAEKYAKRVVSSCLKKRPSAWIWLGTGSTVAWFIDTFLWRTVVDGIFSKMVGLNSLPGLLRGRKSILEPS